MLELYNESSLAIAAWGGHGSLLGLFGTSWDFPSSSRPTTWSALSPPVYEQERARVAARFEEAVRLAEQAFLDEFARLVAHLTERITGANDDGTPKVFRDSAVDNLSSSSSGSAS